MKDDEIAGDEWGDLACVQCLDEHQHPETFGVLPKMDLITLGQLLEAFGRDLQCDCGRLRWDARTQTVTITASA